MSTIHIFFLIFFLVGSFCMIISIGLMFYIGKTRIKEIDKAVLGYEHTHDSIFLLMLRVPNYGGGFLWKWSAKRGGLKGKIEHFDAKFRRPFIINFILISIGVICLTIAVIIGEYYGLVD